MSNSVELWNARFKQLQLSDAANFQISSQPAVTYKNTIKHTLPLEKAFDALVIRLREIAQVDNWMFQAHTVDSSIITLLFGPWMNNPNDVITTDVVCVLHIEYTVEDGVSISCSSSLQYVHQVVNPLNAIFDFINTVKATEVVPS